MSVHGACEPAPNVIDINANVSITEKFTGVYLDHFNLEHANSSCHGWLKF